MQNKTVRGIKNSLIFIAVWVVSFWIVNSVSYDDFNIIVSLALAVLAIFLWKKVENRYFKNSPISELLENKASDDEDPKDFESIFDEYDNDVLYEKAREIVRKNKSASPYLLQKKLKIGYERATRLIDEIKKEGY
jgi:DNA segregation ATPase FtsK/SpoIIIE-like protein